MNALQLLRSIHRMRCAFIQIEKCFSSSQNTAFLVERRFVERKQSSIQRKVVSSENKALSNGNKIVSSEKNIFSVKIDLFIMERKLLLFEKKIVWPVWVTTKLWQTFITIPLIQNYKFCINYYIFF